MDDLIRRSEAQELLECYTEKNNLGHTPYQIVSNLPSAGPKWISAEKEQPKDSKPVLCWCEYYHWKKEKVLPEYGIGYYIPSWNIWGGDVMYGKDAKVLYWMPMPEPPKEVQNGD